MRPSELISRSSVRFLIVGGANTLATSVLVSVLSLWIAGWLAFTIAFATGLVFSVVAAGGWVFRSTLTPLRVGAYIGAYLVIFCCGLGLIKIMALIGLPPFMNGATVLVTAPLGFVAGRAIFPARSDEEPPAREINSGNAP